METRMELLLNISNTDPNRDMGPLDKLKESLSKTGLINPLTIDTEGKLLAGRRRYRAMIELGWEECLVRILDPKDEVEALMISLHENLRRKPLTEAENRRMITEIDELMREKARQKIVEKSKQSSDSEQTVEKSSIPDSALDWSVQKTADKLGISKGSVSEAKKAKAHVEKHPELAREKTPVVLKHKAKEEFMDKLPEEERGYFKREGSDFEEIKEKVKKAKKVDEAIEKLPDETMKTKLQKERINPYARHGKEAPTVEELERERLIQSGLTGELERKWLDKGERFLERWLTEAQDTPIKDSEIWKFFDEGRIKLRESRTSVKSLKRVDLPIGKFGSREHAEEYAKSHGGYCAGRGVVTGKGVWIIYVDNDLDIDKT